MRRPQLQNKDELKRLKIDWNNKKRGTLAFGEKYMTNEKVFEKE